MKRNSLSGALFLAFIAVGWLVGDASATSSVLRDFNARYGTAGTRLDNCGTCHGSFTGSGGTATPYFRDLVNANRDFAAIESLDSDGDGDLNVDEITDRFEPGWTCDTYSNALNAPSNLAEYVELSNPGCQTQVSPEIDVNPLSVAFGLVDLGASTTREVTIQNLGNGDLNVSSLEIAGTAEFTVVSPSAPFVVAAGDQQMVALQYAPSNEGLDEATLNIASDDANESNVAVALTGTGAPIVSPEPEIDVSPLAIDFGSVEINGSATQSVTIRNLGGADLTISDIQFVGSSEYAFNEPAVPLTVGPGTVQELPIIYSPIDEGSDTASLSIASDDADEPTVTIDIRGSGFQPGPALVDLEIAQLRADKRVDIERLQSVEVILTVKNAGTDPGERPAVLEAWQDGVLIFETQQMVSDSVGNGRSRFTFGPWIPSSPGVIEWIVRILDDDEFDDVASATTLVIHRERMAGANLSGADLRGENLQACDLTGANLCGADLSRADLTGAIGLNSTLSDATTRYSAGTLFTDTDFDPQSAGWSMVDDATITRETSFGDVKSRFKE